MHQLRSALIHKSINQFHTDRAISVKVVTQRSACSATSCANPLSSMIHPRKMLSQMSRLSIALSATLSFSLFYKSTTTHSTIPAEDPACLTADEAQSIASQFVQIFNTNSTNQPTTNKEILSTLIGPDYTEINGDSILCSDSHGKTECGFIGSVPLFRNREQVLRAYESLGLAATNDVTRECQTRVVHAFASCDEIAIRYEAEGRANNGVRGV